MNSRLAMVMLAMLAGCAVGPDFHPPDAPKDAGYFSGKSPERTASSPVLAGHAQFFRPGGDLTGEWWTLFHSEPLDRLIDDALRANPDLAAAQAALRQANENVYAGAGRPVSQCRRQLSAGTRAHLRRGVRPAETEQYAQPGDGGAECVRTRRTCSAATRRQIESLAAQADYQRFQLEATYLTLTSNLVVAAVQEASLRGQIAGDARHHPAGSAAAWRGAAAVRAGWRGEIRRAVAAGDADRDRGHVAAAAKAAGADTRSACRVARAVSEPAAGGTVRSGQPAPADRSAGQPAVAACRAAAGHARRGGDAACGQRQCRRRDRQPAAAVHHQRAIRQRGARLYQPVHARDRHLEHRRRHHAETVRCRHSCCTRSAPRSPRSSRRRRNTAAR